MKEENNTKLRRELRAICQELQEKMNIINTTVKGHSHTQYGTANLQG